MKLRNGKILPTPVCYSCKRFYGNSEWNWKCSECSQHCSPNTVSQFHKKAFQRKLQEWACERIADARLLSVLKWQLKQYNGAIITKNTMASVLSTLSTFKQSGKFITAEFAANLLRNCGIDNSNKSHLICPFILDWWNMQHYDFMPYEICYYGRFRDDPALHIKSMPPPPPNTTEWFRKIMGA